MKVNGIVRKIDELGRIVIPKEIRNNLGMKEGTAVDEQDKFCKHCGKEL